MSATKGAPPTDAPVISCLREDWATGYQKQPGKPDPDFPYPAHPPKGPKKPKEMPS